jgi:light-regulated signal transduction histidine kinase (bacteriophytochrome)
VSLLIPEGRDINELKQAENEVRKLNEELEQRVQKRTAELETTNREMDSFQYSASHDLRTPLRGIDGYAQILLEDYADFLDDAAANYLRSIRRGAQRMGEIIDDMLKMSRITQHKMYISEIDLTSIVQSFAREYQEVEPQREIEFTIAEDIHAVGDEYLISIALENLLGNAVKFTRHRKISKITFGTLEMEGKKVFYIQDNGAGFNIEYKGKLFTAFQRLHRQDQFEGSGVGLAIANRVISRHKGEIWAEAEEGEGATFYFTIGMQPS